MMAIMIKQSFINCFDYTIFAFRRSAFVAYFKNQALISLFRCLDRYNNVQNSHIIKHLESRLCIVSAAAETFFYSLVLQRLISNCLQTHLHSHGAHLWPIMERQSSPEDSCPEFYIPTERMQPVGCIPVIFLFFQHFSFYSSDLKKHEIPFIRNSKASFSVFSVYGSVPSIT